MSLLKSFFLAIDLATRQRDELMQVVAAAHSQVQFAMGQMGQLQSYASDSDARWTDANWVGLSGELVRHHYQFMARLQHAIELQNGVIRSLNAKHASAQKELQQAEIRLATLQKLVKKKLTVQQHAQARREQLQTDEVAALQFVRQMVSPITENSHGH